jgi:hypothetical protein
MGAVRDYPPLIANLGIAGALGILAGGLSSGVLRQPWLRFIAIEGCLVVFRHGLLLLGQ